MIRGLFVVGAVLLSLNFAGAFITIRQANVPSLDVVLADLDQAFIEYGRSPEFLSEVTKTIGDSVESKWFRWENKESLHPRVPLTENWALWLASYFDPIIYHAGIRDQQNLFAFYEYPDYETALERGIGLCSQFSLLVSDLLRRRYNIDAYPIGLGGHVVAEADLNGSKYILDADKSVFLPFGVEGANINVAFQYYNDFETASLYGPEGNGAYRPQLYKVNSFFYIVKWGFPIMILSLALFLWRRSKRESVLS